MVTTREQAAPIAEAILRKWLAVHAEKPSEPAWRADNAGWRMLFWTAHAPLILSSTDLVYRSLVLNCIARTARHLDRGAEKRSEEHTSELQSLMRISYAVFCLKKKNTARKHTTNR